MSRCVLQQLLLFARIVFSNLANDAFKISKHFSFSLFKTTSSKMLFFCLPHENKDGSHFSSRRRIVCLTTVLCDNKY